VARANDDIEQTLLEFADLLSILTTDPHKPRSYEKAARSVGGYHADVSTLDMKGILQIPNVGKSIGEKIVELLQDGTFADLEALRAQIPPGVRELMSIPGLGPKKAMVLYQELGVASVPELVAAIEDERVAGLKGFGGKTQENILRGLQQLSDSGGRVLVNAALDVAESLLSELDGMKQVGRSAFAGSLRRMRETIGDVDLLVASDSAAPIMDAFVGLPSASRVIAHGDTKSSILTDRGLQVDLRVIPKEVWGAAMIYFTGSKAHNIRIREMAVRAGLKLSEYGLLDNTALHEFKPGDSFKVGKIQVETIRDFTLRPSTGGEFNGGSYAADPLTFAEVGITVVRQLGPHFALEGGYRVFYMPRLATGGAEPVRQQRAGERRAAVHREDRRQREHAARREEAGERHHEQRRDRHHRALEHDQQVQPRVPEVQDDLPYSQGEVFEHGPSYTERNEK